MVSARAIPNQMNGEPDLDSRSRENSQRAQTTIDFLIGAGVFLLVFGFVISVIPGMIDPFEEGQETPLVADRIASQVTESMLGEPTKPTILNATCTNAFFNQSLGSGSNCGLNFSPTETDLSERLGVADKHSINVSIKRDIDGDGDLEQLATDGKNVSTTGHTELAIGPRVPIDAEAVVSATRIGFLDGKDVTVVVRVW